MSDEILDFVTARMVAHASHDRPRCWGISSDALTLYALGKGPRPQVPGNPTHPGWSSWHGEEMGRDYPHDLDDLGACERTYEMAPAVLQISMLPVLAEFRAWVHEGRNRYGEVVWTPYEKRKGMTLRTATSETHLGTIEGAT